MSTDFYQPGTTYSHPMHDWAFRVDAITTHPENNELTALGWRFFKGEWEPCAYHRDDWEIGQLAGWIEEQSSRPAADATPGLTGRQARLLDAIRTHEGPWTTARALSLYALTDPGVVQRGTARRDLEALHKAGHLALVDDPDNRHFVLHRKGDA
ncbi:MarR family transcriptional regulator [Streptomyces sp. NPDC001781]